MKRTEIINKLIKDNGYKFYLEIGLGTLENFKGIKCDLKVGIDPAIPGSKNTARIDSDSFFAHNVDTYDLIFIDALHHAEQVERDILNAWNSLNKGGPILIHDIKPLDEICQIVPRQSVSWTGDVWRAWHGLKNTKLKLEYLDERVGLGLIWKSRHKLELGFVNYETSYKEYNSLKGWEV